MTARAHVIADAGHWRRSAQVRVAMSFLFALGDLVFVAFAVIGWSAGRLAQLVDLVLLGASCAVGVLVTLVLAGANLSALRAVRAGRTPARGAARAALCVAALRIPALALAIYLVAASTTPRPDGSWHLLPGAPLLGIGFLEILATLVLAAATTSALRRLAPR